MADTRTAYALAVKLHQELGHLADQGVKVDTALELSDQLAREMGWIWVSEGDR